jgi:hypothetical protein
VVCLVVKENVTHLIMQTYLFRLFSYREISTTQVIPIEGGGTMMKRMNR